MTDFDGGGFTLNFTDQEASSEAREFSTLPSGSYLVCVTDVELKESQSEKHNGKPYASFEFTIQEDAHDGQYVGQKAWGNVMLFAGALYSAAQLMKAWDLVPGQDNFPELEATLGKTVVILGRQEDVKTKDDNGKYVTKYEDVPGPNGVLQRKAVKRYEIKGYRHPNTWKKTAAAGGTKGASRLPS